MAELRDEALLLRRIPFSETSLICHFLTAQHGRIALMARGARRPKSPFRATLEPLHTLAIHWRSGRSGMGTLTDVTRGDALLPPALSLEGLELLAIVARLFQEGDPHGFSETKQALQRLNTASGNERLLAAIWQLLNAAGWLGDLSHCWHCGEPATGMMHWQHAQLRCANCGTGLAISTGLRRSIDTCMAGQAVRFSQADHETWRTILRQTLREHGIHVRSQWL